MRAAISAKAQSSRQKGKGRAATLGHAVVTAAHTGLHQIHPSTAGPSTNAGISSSDFDDLDPLKEGDWDTDATYDLVEQTRSLLVLAHRQGLDLFSATNDTEFSGTSISPRPKRKGGRFSSSASAIPQSVPPRTEHALPSANTSSTLLSRMITMLKSLIAIDCLHRTRRFRPLCPPNALQAACLDIASFLYHKCGVEIKVQIVDIVVNGLYSMDEGMTERLCEWIEGRLGELLGRLARERGGPKESDSKWTVPTFAISSAPNDEPIPTSSTGWLRYSPVDTFVPRFISADDKVSGMLSTHASSTELASAVRHVAALVPQILLAISATVFLGSATLSTIHRVHRLLSLVLTAKPDAALDLLEIVAYAPAIPRRHAMAILGTFYPQVTGHNITARRSPLCTYSAQREKWESGQDWALGEEETGGHHYVPWRFSSTDKPDESVPRCSICAGDLHGFCVRCTLCGENRHLRCYEVIDQVFQYDLVTLSSRNSAPTVVKIKFSKVIPRLEEKLVDSLTTKGNAHSTRRRIGQHDLHLVNVFDLTLCGECCEPLWGSTSQAYACMSGCQRFFHPLCCEELVKSEKSFCYSGKSVVVDEVSARGHDPFSIDIETLRASFERNLPASVHKASQLHERSFDEVAVLYGSLWIQYQLYKNGVSSGSLRIVSDGQHPIESDVIGLRDLVKTYEERLLVLDGQEDAASSAAVDFAGVTSMEGLLGRGYLFSDKFLTYAIALLRAPSDPATEQGSPDNYLSAQPRLSGPAHDNDTVSRTYETLTISTIRRVLASDFNMHDERVAALFLDHLRSMGLCSAPSKAYLVSQDVSAGDTWLSFTLPLLMDSSPTVEILICAIEALLDDLDLTSNEQCLVLLTRRAWPSLLCSPYALERLGGAVLAWIMAQEYHLHHAVRDYASKHHRIPGVRTGGAKGAPSVQLYKDSRQQLLERYTRPWLLALHDQDPALYAHVAYEQSKSPARRVDSQAVMTNDQVAIGVANLALERIGAVVDAQAIFSASIDILIAWLEDLGGLTDRDMTYKALPRILRHIDSLNAGSSTDLWTIAQETSSESTQGFERVCTWMRVLAFSGVEIPWELLQSLVDLGTAMECSMEARLDLIIAVDANAAYMDSADFAHTCDRLMVNPEDLSGSVRLTPKPSESELHLLNRTLLVVLKGYGVAEGDMSGTVFDKMAGSRSLPAPSVSKKRRAMSNRVTLDLNEATVLVAADLLNRGRYPAEMILDFLWLLFTRAVLVANVDGFLHEVAASLFPALWRLIDLPIDRRSRARLFLRLLAVRPEPMEDLVKQVFRAGDRPVVRERLLVFFVELADESILFENLGWRRAAVGMLLLFFDMLFDHNDTTPDTLTVTRCLLSTHLQAVSACFEEYLVQSSDERRLAILARLHRLRLMLPNWRIISWRTMQELLGEQVANIAALTSASSAQSASAFRDGQMVRASLLALGLDMLSTGMEIGWIAAGRFQQHLASACAMPWTSPADGLTSLVLPALRQVLDSPLRLNVSGTMGPDKTKRTTLVGAIFVPVVIDFGKTVGNQDEMVQRLILDILMTVFFKHNVQPVELSALNALAILADCVKSSQCSEHRLLAIQIIQTTLTRLRKESLIRSAPSVFNTLAQVLLNEIEKVEGDSAIIDEARSTLSTLIRLFGRSGLFWQVLKHEAIENSATDESILGRALQALEPSGQDANRLTGLVPVTVIFHDLPDVLKRGRQTVMHVLTSLSRFVASLRGEVPEDATQNFGVFLSKLGKHVSEWEASEFDCSPTLCAAAGMIKLSSPSVAATLVHQISTILHLCLAKFSVEHSTLSTLLSTSSASIIQDDNENTIRTVIFELAGSAINGLTVTPITLATLLQFVTDLPSSGPAINGHQSPSARQDGLLDAAPGCVSILLRSHPTLASVSINPDELLPILTQAATVLIKADVTRTGTLHENLFALPNEAAIVQLNVFTYILFASVQSNMGENNSIYALYPVIARAASVSLRACADYLLIDDASGDGAELLSMVFTILRLVVLLSVTRQDNLPQQAMAAYWNRISADWLRLVFLSLEGTCINGPLRAVSHSVFFDVVIFLNTTSSPILISHTAQFRRGLSTIAAYQQSNNGQISAKYHKAVSAIETAGQEVKMVDVKGILEAIRGDLKATERLRALRAR